MEAELERRHTAEKTAAAETAAAAVAGQVSALAIAAESTVQDAAIAAETDADSGTQAQNKKSKAQKRRVRGRIFKLQIGKAC